MIRNFLVSFFLFLQEPSVMITLLVLSALTLVIGIPLYIYDSKKHKVKDDD